MQFENLKGGTQMQAVGERRICSEYAVGEEVEVFVRSYVSVFVDLNCGMWRRGRVEEISPCGEGGDKTFFLTVYVDELKYGKQIGVYEGRDIRKING